MASDNAIAVEPRPLESLSSAQYQKYRMTGEIPAEGAKDETPAAEKSEKETPAAKPATEKGTEAKPEPKLTRLGYSDLRNKVREQEAEIERLRANPRTEVEEVTAKETPKEEKKEARPRQSDVDDKGKPKFATWEEYEDALLAWNRKEALAEFESTQTKRQQEAQVEKQNREILSSWKERVDKAKETHADFDAALDPKEGPSAKWKEGSLLDTWILDSDLGAEILYYFHTHRSEVDRIGAMKPIAAARELTKLEAKLEAKPVEAQPEQKPEKKATKVPPPTREVGGRGTTAVDEVTKAVIDDDPRAYINAANRAAIAAKR